ncbi:MAG: hypothetical protein GY758_14540 [Fuerstiella sp.]|nr:hypothetical protein [Fuerstiella sp.]MCP4508521.1 hypothetical protein [Fuerstiella sp.]
MDQKLGKSWGNTSSYRSKHGAIAVPGVQADSTFTARRTGGPELIKAVRYGSTLTTAPVGTTTGCFLL